MYTRRFAGGAAAAALALFAAACADAPTTPAAARAADGRASLSQGSGPALVSTAVKYRDTGGKPARGRSGNAVVDAFALLDKGGLTTVQLSAGEGSINKAKVRASAPDGQHKFTYNVTASDLRHVDGPIPTLGIQLRGLGRGDQVQLQANVEGIDPHRVDVVTVTETVKRLPDLSVELTAPAEVEAGTPLNVMAIVREGNGDMGGSGTCELYVAGERVDVATGVWVDAGDVVTCAMTWTPGTPGSYPLEVRITPWGRDWDAANHTDTATLQVNGASPRFYADAWFMQATRVDSLAWSDTWQNTETGYVSVYGAEDVQTETYQDAYMYGHMPAHTTGQVDLRFSMSTGGRIVDAGEFTWDAGESTPWCQDFWGGRAMFFMCSDGGVSGAYTDFTYSFMAGAVTYHGMSYSRTWDPYTDPEESVYHWNYSTGDTVDLGDDWTFDVRLNTAGGEHVLTRVAQLVRTQPDGWTYPYTCSTWGSPEWGLISTYCNAESHYTWFIAGDAV